MEELFDNFAKHIEHMISPKLGKDIKKYIRHSVNSETSPEEYSKVESDIKNIMANYFHNATDKDFLEMATNLFNAYVENDDENLIRSVKYFIRIYTYFQNIKLKKKLYILPSLYNVIKLLVLYFNNSFFELSFTLSK